MSPADRVEASDVELLKRAMAGDRDAFAAIYDRYHGVVYRFARMMSGSTAVAEDVTHEVFVLLMKDLGRYRAPLAALSTFLYGMARNVIRSRLRRERRYVDFGVVGTGVPEPSIESDPVAGMTQAAHLASLRRAITELPPRFREAVILCDLHGLPYAEAAAILRVPVGTVRSRLHRARSVLTERLRELEQNAARSLARDAARCLA